MLSAEIAIYPENTNQGDQIVNNSIQAINDLGINSNVDHMNTKISGNEEQVWSGLRRMCQETAKQGDFSMVVTLTNH